MKYVLIKKQPLAPHTVNIKSSAYYDREYQEVFETADITTVKEALRIPPQNINITVTGRYITENLIKAITPAYLRGSNITINGIQFKPCKANPQYFYTWQENIPSTLPYHLKEAALNRSLRNTLYDELVAWNQSRIQRAIEASKFKWDFAETFYKELFKTFRDKKVQSPNKKTFYEATAELLLENILRPSNPLTDEEELYLYNAATRNQIRAFGLQDCDITLGTKHRTTPHGTTEEPCTVDDAEINAQVTASFFCKKDSSGQTEGYLTDEGFEVHHWTSTRRQTVTLLTRQRENIQTLKWFLSLPQETQVDLLLPGWRFCPVCNALYHESEGCYDGDDCHVEELNFLPYNENHSDEDEEEN